MTTSEQQRRWRKKTNRIRLDVWLDPGAAGILNKLASTVDETSGLRVGKPEAIRRLLLAVEKEARDGTLWRPKKTKQ